MWDEEDGFYYDLLRLPDGSATRLKVRSMVGLLPLCATTVIEKAGSGTGCPSVAGDRSSERVAACPSCSSPSTPPARGTAWRTGASGARQPGAAPPDPREDARRERVPEPVRHPLALAVPRAHPYVFHVGGQGVPGGLPAGRVDTGMFGGNSNWRGPVWMPVNVLHHPGAAAVLPVLRRRFTDRVPHRLGQDDEPLRGEQGDRRPAQPRSSCATRRGGARSTAARRSSRPIPHWRDHILFYEYFHGDNGAGLGASHQTGWTGLVAKLIQLFGTVDRRAAARGGQAGGVRPGCHAGRRGESR